MSTYITEKRKKQKELLDALFTRFRQFSDEQFLISLFNKSFNELTLYPFQDVNDTEVLTELNDLLIELEINAQYKRKALLKLLCEQFLDSDFHIYDKTDRPELKFVILKVLLLIGDSGYEDHGKEIKEIYEKYFCAKPKEEPKILNRNEERALQEINRFNREEELKYLEELRQVEEELDELVEDGFNEEKGDDKKEKEPREDKKKEDNRDIATFQNEWNLQEECKTDGYYNEVKFDFIENSRKKKSPYTYEQVVKKVCECVCEYPYYDNLNDELRKERRRRNKKESNNELPSDDVTYQNNYEHFENQRERKERKEYEEEKTDVSSYDNSQWNEIISEEESSKEFENENEEDMFLNLQKKRQRRRDTSYTHCKSREQYFFNNIDIFNEPYYSDSEEESSLIFNTEVYNLRHVFNSDINKNQRNQKKEETKKEKEKEENMNQNNIIPNGKREENVFTYSEALVNRKGTTNIVDSKIKQEEQLPQNKGKQNIFYVSEIFIVKEILMILSLNCPIKYKNHFYMNFSNFFCELHIEEEYIKEDVLFYIEIKKRKKENQGYHAVIRKRMDVKLYNISKRSFNIYIKKMKKMSIKLLYMNIFFFLVEKFRKFFFFLPSNLKDLFNYIILIRENLSEEYKKKIFFFFDQDRTFPSNNNNRYYQGNFLDHLVQALKNIYHEWCSIIDVLYNYHFVLVSMQFNITYVSNEKVFQYLQKIQNLKTLNFLKMNDFVMFKKKGKHRKVQDISNFRFLSLIHLNFILSTYVYIWNGLYDFINGLLSYLLYHVTLQDYMHFNSIYDNSKKFSVCYDLVLLKWRYYQIINNQEMEKVFRFLLNELNDYYCKHLSQWVNKGRVADPFNEFFIFVSKEQPEKHQQHQALIVKEDQGRILCPEFFHSFIYFLISLGNNIRLCMQMEKDANVDFVKYYLNEYRKTDHAYEYKDHEMKHKKGMISNNNYCNTTTNNINTKRTMKYEPWKEDEQEQKSYFMFHEDSEEHTKKLHENTLNYYYDLENIQPMQKNVLNQLSEFLHINYSSNEKITKETTAIDSVYFNKNIMDMHISYDIYMKKYMYEEIRTCYLKSKRIFLYNLMKHCYFLEYFCCLRSIVFLEIGDFLIPFFEFLFKDVSIPVLEERNINIIFRHCVYSSSNIISAQSFYERNYCCTAFLHRKFTRLHKQMFINKQQRQGKKKKRKSKKRNLSCRNVDASSELSIARYMKEKTKKIRRDIGKVNGRMKLTEKKMQMEQEKENHEKEGYISRYSDEEQIEDTVNDREDEVDYTDEEEEEEEEEESNFSEHSLYEENQNGSEYKIETTESYESCNNNNYSYINNMHSADKANDTIFFTEERITSIMKSIYFRLKENKMYNNRIHVINYRNLIIETKISPFINFIFGSSCLQKYSAIFSYVLEIKKSLQILNLVHIFYKYVRTKRSTMYNSNNKMITALYILKSKIFFFINTIYNFSLWMLDFAWNILIFNLSVANSLEQIQKHHEYYLNFLIETLLVPIQTEHVEWFELDQANEFKSSEIKQKYEQTLYASTFKEGKHNGDVYPSDKVHEIALTEKQKKRNENEDINGSMHTSVNSKFLLNELFSSNILNILSISTKIYEILKKCSKQMKVNLDMNFDNTYDNTVEPDEQEQDQDPFDEEDPYDKEGESQKTEFNKIHFYNSNDMHAVEYEKQVFSSIQKDIKTLSEIFDIHFSELVKKLNIISFNVEDQSFFGMKKYSPIFNHILRIDKNILKKVSILENLLSFNMQKNMRDIG